MGSAHLPRSSSQRHRLGALLRLPDPPYSLTEEEFSKLKKQADHGYMMDEENRRLKEELSTAKKEADRWSIENHDLWYDVKPYLDALHRAPELVRGFLEKILAPKQELTMNVQQRNHRRGQDMEL